MLRKPDGGSRGFGFVTFKDEMSVEKCLVMQHVLNGKQARAAPRDHCACLAFARCACSGEGCCVHCERCLCGPQVEIKRAVKKEDMGGPGAVGAYMGGAGGPMRTGKAPDWLCPDPSCRNKNFGWREECNRCHVRSDL